jgi:hypothetical protein
MALSRVDREKITDSMLKIQSARSSLETVEEAKIEDFEHIQECLENADKNLRSALRQVPVKKDSTPLK